MIDRVTGRSAPEPAEEASEAEDGSQEQKPKTVTLTEAELAERDRRARQSERDRLAAEANRPKQPTRAEIRAQEIERGETNPWEFTEAKLAELKQEAETEKFHQSVSEFASIADASMLDPVLTRLPEPVWRALVDEHKPSTFTARQALVTAALDKLEEHALEKAKQDLRNPKSATGRAFRKELLSELRGSIPEPELVQAGARSSGVNGHASENGFMNSQIRRAARAARSAGEGDRDHLEDDDDE
jgi:hypothetical protein